MIILTKDGLGYILAIFQQLNCRVAIWHIFKPKIQISENFGRCFMAIWSILWPFGIFCHYWYIFYYFGMLYQRKSGNPAQLVALPVCQK
jgi:hypothetical protein